MKIFAFVVAINFSLLSANEYWQQFVTYKMNVQLDTTKHTVGGHSTITYKNNSPDTLYHFYLNLYANAFQEGTVKHREYLAGLGRTSRGNRFKKGMDPYLSKYDISNFIIKSTGSTLSDTFFIDDTILSAKLSKGLAPGASMVIDLDWTHHVGQFAERAGRVGEQYNFAQWYPRVVVYDENGWFDEPFHAEGEFYGEFGTYDVTMDVPKGYIIGSTGIVTSGDPGWEEVRVDTSKNFNQWLKDFRKNRTNYDENERRVVTFYAEEVHDFAWVTTPNFLYESGSWNGVDVHALFNQKNGKKWTKKVVARTERAVEWLSTKFGMYPYPQVTNTDRLAGGGMEYPMLVMDGSESEGLILHEVGHIWFFGILANNEVREAWLDEGFTNFQTRWYMMDRYGDQGFDKNGGRLKKWQKKHWKFASSLGNTQWGMIGFMSSGLDEPISRSTYMFKGTRAAGANAYTKPSLMLDELKYILGEETFSKSMQEYYRRWKLKHTNEKRFIDIVEEVSEEDLDWFFRPWLHDTRLLDYGLKNLKKIQKTDGTWDVTLEIIRHGKRDMPQLIETTLKDGSKHRAWWKNHKFRTADTFTYNVPSEPKNATLDPDAQTMDIDYRNNFVQTKMPSELMFYRPGMRYLPRNKYVLQYHPTMQYHDIDGYAPGVKLKRNYGLNEELIFDLNVGGDSGQTLWKISGWRRYLHKGMRKNSYYLYDFGGVRGFGVSSSNQLDVSSSNPTVLTVGVSVTDATDLNRTNLFDKGLLSVVSIKLENERFNNGSLMIDFSPGGISDWSFTRLTLQDRLEKKKNFYGFRNRDILGWIWSDSKGVPVQERYTVEGAGSGTMLEKGYLRDASSFYGDYDLRSQYHLPGDANLRAFGNQNFAGVEKIFSNSFEAFVYKKLGPVTVEVAAFIDNGILSGSKFEANDRLFDNTSLMDYGFGLRLSTNIFGQPLYLRIDKPIDATIDGSSLEKMNEWVFSFQKAI
jgi:hypothetical protein